MFFKENDSRICIDQNRGRRPHLDIQRLGERGQTKTQEEEYQTHLPFQHTNSAIKKPELDNLTFLGYDQDAGT